MPIKLNSTGGGSVTLDTGSTASNFTLTVPSNTGTLISTASTFAGTGPAFLSFADGTQAVSNVTYTKITLPTESFDTANAFASNTFTPSVAGYYIFTFMVNLNILTGVMVSELRKNGVRAALGNLTAGSSIEGASGGSAILYLNGTTDYVDLYAYQNSGGASTCRNSSYLSGALVRAA